MSENIAVVRKSVWPNFIRMQTKVEAMKCP